MSSPSVSILITTRDRFGFVRETIEEIYKHTEIPFQMVVVDCNFPKKVSEDLKRLSEEKGFEVIRVNHYLAPSIARNLGSKRCTGKYITFVENDCLVTPGWLTTLVRCAEEAGADAVSPLITEGVPLHTVVHFAGGTIDIQKKVINGKEHRILIDQIRDQGKKLPEARAHMKREEAGAFEVHCLLMRRSMLEKMGYFDKEIVSKEHVDAVLTVRKLGGKIYFEPGALVGFMSEPPLGPPLESMDIAYYMLRWCDRWEMQSLHRMRDKWGLSEAEFFPKRYANVGWRRRMFVVRPFCRKFTLGKGVSFLENAFYKAEIFWNKLVADNYEKKYSKINATY